MNNTTTTDRGRDRVRSGMAPCPHIPCEPLTHSTTNLQDPCEAVGDQQRRQLRLRRRRLVVSR